jgi:GTP-binding protein HflX
VRRKSVLLTNRPSNAEMEELIFALGADLVATIYQRRPQPDPQLFLGSGKIEEARRTRAAFGAQLVIVNAALKPSQIFNLQQAFREGAGDEAEHVEVYDRTRLILEIFRERARSPEARLQVELATLQYEMPLVKEAISQAKRGERQAGMFGGGEYEVNQYHDMMKRRMVRIRRDLEKMRRERDLRRRHRRRGGFHLVSLAGYTNAGKSSLLKALSEEHVLAENRYFSTLSTKTARAKSERREILVTDTVGFIEDLPPWMVEAFHSTLEEIALADVILLVVDATDTVEEMARRLRSSLRILWEFDGAKPFEGEGPFSTSGPMLPPRTTAAASPAGDGEGQPSDVTDAGGSADAPTSTPRLPVERVTTPGPASGGARLLVPTRKGLAPILVALNKMDALPPGELETKAARLEADGLLPPDQWVGLSARTGAGLPELYDRLYALIPDYDEFEVCLRSTPEGEAFIAWLHDHADVLDLTRGNEIHLHFEAKRSLRPDLQQRLAAVGADPLKEVQRSREPPPREEGLGGPEGGRP